MEKRIVGILLAAVLLVFSLGVSGAETVIQVENAAAVPAENIADSNPVIEGESPLTGLPAGVDAYTPVMVPLDNSPEAHPLWGISDASIIFQVPLADNGATRLLGLYADSFPEQAGGVRSGRMTMLPLARAFHAVFVYAGFPPIGSGNVSVSYYLDQWSFRKPTRHYNLLGDRFRERVDYYKSPFNLSVHLKELHEHLATRDMDFEVRPFLFTDDPLSRGEEASEISLQFHGKKSITETGNANSNCSFAWTESGYSRTSASGEMTDRTTGNPVLFSNVIIMRVPVEWERDYPFYHDQLRGQGQADIFQSGRYIRGSWSHASRTGRLVFLDETGKELRLQRGKTFVVLGDENIVVSYR